MHELGIANSVVDAVRTELARQAAGARPIKVGLRIGPMAAVDSSSLTFCFDAIVKGTDLEALQLDVQEGALDDLEFSYLEVEVE